MHDQALFLRTMSEFARALPAAYQVETVLPELTERVTAVLDLAGSGVTLASAGRLQFIGAVGTASNDLEHVQEHHQVGPCRDAYDFGRPVCANDIAQRSADWPEYAAAAHRFGVVAVAGIPMRLGDSVVGALNLYTNQARTWSSEDIAVASVLADMATGYIVNASKLQQQKQLNAQLQHALDARVVIEQAKGITAQRCGITVEEAFQRIRHHARSHNNTLRSVADAIVTAGLQV